MITLGDVLFKIAQRMHGYTGADRSAAIEEFIIGYAHDLHLAITTDVAGAEDAFRANYGKGHTFFFRLKNYEHGRSLTAQMYWLLLGRQPESSIPLGGEFSKRDKLFLVIFARDHSAQLGPIKRALPAYVSV